MPKTIDPSRQSLQLRPISTALLLLAFAASAPFAEARPAAEPEAVTTTQHSAANAAANRPAAVAEGEGAASAIAQARAVAQEVAAAFPGLAVAVGADGEVVWSEGFGWADLEQRVAVTAQTRFPVYSLSKAWTATAAARLAEGGRLDPEAPLATYLPELAPPLAAATTMQLATHRAGIRHYRDEREARAPAHCETVADALPLFLDDPLLFEPGADRAYSSWGYVLLSAVVEAAAGEPFDAHLRRTLFEPLGMTSTALADPYPLLPHRARPYERREDGTLGNAAGPDATCKWGAGAYLATAGDAVRFYLGLLDGRLLSPPMTQLILRPDAAGRHRFGGAGAGGRAQVVADTGTGVVVALLANERGDDVDLHAAAEAIAELFTPPAQGQNDQLDAP